MIPNPADQRKGKRERLTFRSAHNNIQALTFDKTVRKGSGASCTSGRNTEQISGRDRVDFVVNRIFGFSANNICNIGIIDNAARNNPSRRRIAVNVIYQIDSKLIIINIVYRKAWV